jgi:hypothetical protein
MAIKQDKLSHQMTTCHISRPGQGSGPCSGVSLLPIAAAIRCPCLLRVRRTRVGHRRLVRVRHHVVFGTLEAVQQVLAACGWQINTAFMAAGLTDRVQSLRDVLMFRVPPWPQPQAL